jgi:hypothetical protein
LTRGVKISSQIFYLMPSLDEKNTASAVHLAYFKQCHPTAPVQGKIGRTPQNYLDEINKLSHSNLEWPAKYDCTDLLDRATVRTICQDPDVHPLIAYAAVMAWGSRNFANLWKHWGKIRVPT